MIDEKGRIFGKINIIDLCVVLVIIAAAVVVYTRFSANKIITEETQTVAISFFIEEASDFIPEQIKIGDQVADDSKNIVLGTITDVSIGPSVYYAPNSEGQIIKSSKEGYCSVSITAEISARPFANGIIIEGNRYMVGHTFTIRAGYGKMWGKISDIVLKGAGN